MSLSKQIKLILLRHGNTFESGDTPVQVGAKTDMPLTQKGLGQALDFANYLKHKKIIPDAIYSGNLKRQTESARLIAKELDILNRVHLNEGALTEVDYGLWEGLTSDQIQEKWPEEYEAWNKNGRWGEDIFGGTLEKHLENVSLWLDKLYSSYQENDVVIGLTSQGAMRFFVSLAANSPNCNMSNLKVKTGHFCELLISKDRVEILSWDVAPKNGEV